jgi:SAM-dependent methyltransferase
MKVPEKYKAYYRYLNNNWNSKIAEHIITTEQLGEEKLGIDTTGIDRLKTLKKTGVDISHANLYMPAPYDMLDIFFEKIALNQLKHLLDLGCGKGRALCVAASYGIPQVMGIDFSKELITAAQENINLVKKQFSKTKFKLFHNDAFYFKIPKTVDCIFLFNPFDSLIMSGVLENIETSLAQYPRKMQVIYFNPVHKKRFLKYGYTETYSYKKLRYLEGVILQK